MERRRPGRPRPIAMGLSAAAALLVLAAACTGAGSSRGPGDTSDQVEGDEVQSGTPTPSPLVDPAEIVSGGPPPDGIPPIDEPRFERARDVRYLDPNEPVIVLEIQGDARAYPAQILMWHEIVNDVVGGVPVAVTYCPLCNTGIVFERPTIDGQLLDFGTSGKLYHSNLVMYDRQTESLWPQALGKAVIGPLTGTELELLPAQLVAWGDWLAIHPDGKVLSRETGVDRPYGENPYAGYDESESPFLFDGEGDRRLPLLSRVVGVRFGSTAVAYPYRVLRSRAVGGWSVVLDQVRGQSLAVFWKAGTVSALDEALIAESRDVGATGVFRASLGGRELTFHATPAGIVDHQTGTTWDIFGRAVDGPLEGRQLDRLVSVESFWFDWAAFFPDTAIYGEGP